MHTSEKVSAMDKENIEIIKRDKKLLEELLETVNTLGDKKQ